MSALPEVLSANQSYASIFHRRDLPLLPRLNLVVLICMDARIDSVKVLGLKDGDAHVIHNAGGRAADALRSLAISHALFGIREIAVIHHTECGMLNLANEEIRQKVEQELGSEAGHVASAIDFLPFSDLHQSVRDDVALIKAFPLLPTDIDVTGFVFDLQTGRLREVV